MYNKKEILGNWIKDELETYHTKQSTAKFIATKDQVAIKYPMYQIVDFNKSIKS